MMWFTCWNLLGNDTKLIFLNYKGQNIKKTVSKSESICFISPRNGNGSSSSSTSGGIIPHHQVGCRRHRVGRPSSWQLGGGKNPEKTHYYKRSTRDGLSSHGPGTLPATRGGKGAAPLADRGRTAVQELLSGR